MRYLLDYKIQVSRQPGKLESRFSSGKQSDCEKKEDEAQPEGKKDHGREDENRCSLSPVADFSSPNVISDRNEPDIYTLTSSLSTRKATTR